MNISEEQLEAVRNFKNTDFSACPILTDEQLAQMQPCHLVSRVATRNLQENGFIAIQIDSDVLAGLRRIGDGWQSKVNEYLRQGLAAHAI